MSSTPSPAVVEAAGALVWRVRLRRLQVAVVHRPRYRDWSWPKGKLDPGETPVAAAVREVAEETGHDVVLGIPLPGLEYRLSDGRTKRVHYWAAQVAGRRDAVALRARPPVPRASRSEIDRVRWMDVGTAARRLTRSADRAPLAALVAAYRKGRLDTHALVVARHGSARKRSAWKGPDADRPLTSDGSRQAEALVPLLSAFGVAHVVTSPWRRCVETVRPYARAVGMPEQRVEAWSEDAHEEAPGLVTGHVDALLHWPGDGVVCTHRPVLGTAFEALAARARKAVAAQLPSEDPYLQPGQLLVAHVAHRPKGPRVVAVEVHGPKA